MSSRAAAQRFRQRKLSVKQTLAVLRESDVDQLANNDAARNMPKVESGVEKGEEVEHHLQAVISASQAQASGGNVAQAFIPTPATVVAEEVQYQNLYPPSFHQPATYIRFSSTVDDTSGCPYSMTADDVNFLGALNQTMAAMVPPTPRCTESDFEEIMFFFESVAQDKQPFAAVDSPPVVPLDEMLADCGDYFSESVRSLCGDIYPYWSSQRLRRGNQPLVPALKFENNLETDDSDPYVCFRRREVRQTRKTRGRDAQVAEKLRKLRAELDDGRLLISCIKEREALLQHQLYLDNTIFSKRLELKKIKRKLGIKGDDDDLLINQKPTPKPKPRIDVPAVQRGIPGMMPKPAPLRSDGRVESEGPNLEYDRAKVTESIEQKLEEMMTKHHHWNVNRVDDTWRPITPPLDPPSARSTYRPAFTSTELTAHSVAAADTDAMEIEPVEDAHISRVRFVTPPDEMPRKEQPRFRRRLGRGGRLWVDRKGLKRKAADCGLGARDADEPDKKRARLDMAERVADRYKFDHDDSTDDELYPVDWTDFGHTAYRVTLDHKVDRAAAPNGHARRPSGMHYVRPIMDPRLAMPRDQRSP